MPVDDLVEGVLRAVARPLVEAFVEIFLRGVCAFVGFWTLRLFSVGRYPPSHPSDRQWEICSFVGLVVLLAGIAGAIWLAWWQHA